jgi:hypothetical protein
MAHTEKSPTKLYVYVYTRTHTLIPSVNTCVPVKMYTWSTRIQMAYAVTQHTVTLPARSLLSKNHMASRYAQLCQFSWNSRFLDNFFLKSPYQISWKYVLLCHRGMDVVSVYGDHFLLRKESLSTTRTNQKFTFLFSPVQQSFSKPTLQFQAVLSDTGD